MTYDYALIKRNIQRAIELVTKQPESNFSLNSYKAERDCGTLFCTAGLLFEQREFRIQLERTELGKTRCPKTPGLLAHCAEMFGEDCYHRLFCCYLGGTYDHDLFEGPMPTHKALALARLNHYLQELNHANG